MFKKEMGTTDKWKQIADRLKELEGKELEGEEVKEWTKLVSMEEQKVEKDEEKQERKAERKRRDVENVPTNMEEKTSQISDISNVVGK